jgi:hypothetical protein
MVRGRPKSRACSLGELYPAARERPLTPLRLVGAELGPGVVWTRAGRAGTCEDHNGHSA